MKQKRQDAATKSGSRPAEPKEIAQGLLLRVAREEVEKLCKGSENK
jgi:hypothetical protein